MRDGDARCQHCPAIITKDEVGAWRNRTTGDLRCEGITLEHRPMPRIEVSR